VPLMVVSPLDEYAERVAAPTVSPLCGRSAALAVLAAVPHESEDVEPAV